MPKEGIFAVVKRGVRIKVGDHFDVTEKQSQSATIIGSKKGGTLSTITKDLASTQKTKDIIIIDETGEIGLALPNLPLEKTSENTYTYKESTIYHLRKEDLPHGTGTCKTLL